MSELAGYAENALPPGIRARFVDDINGLRMHVLEAGHETPGRPCVLLLHGFPELAYSWRKVMLPLAAGGEDGVGAGPRGRGRSGVAHSRPASGRTPGWGGSYDAAPDPFRILNMVRDATGLVHALGYKS